MATAITTATVTGSTTNGCAITRMIGIRTITTSIISQSTIEIDRALMARTA